MRWYRSVWLCGMMPVALLGLFGAVVAAALPQLLSLVLVVVIVASSTAWAYGVRPPDRVIGIGLMAAGAAAVVVGLGSLLGGGVVLPLLAIAVLSPPVVSLALRHLTWAGVRAAQSAPGRSGGADDSPMRSGPGAATRLRGREPGGATTPVAPSTDRPVLPTDWMTQPATTMDGPALCLAWRRTSTVLGREPSSPVVEALVRRRQELLDEMERRNGDGFRAWLASGARASGDPSRYIVASDMPRPRRPSE